jgi:hypothetical protein
LREISPFVPGSNPSGPTNHNSSSFCWVKLKFLSFLQSNRKKEKEKAADRLEFLDSFAVGLHGWVFGIRRINNSAS